MPTSTPKLTDEIEEAIAGRKAANFIARFPVQLNLFIDRLLSAPINNGSVIGLTRNKNYNNGCATCNPKNINEKGAREPVYTRALFNERYINLNDGPAALVEYEAPLIPDGSLACQLDLVAYNPGVLSAIEYKQKSGGATDLEYAMLEVLAYSILLSRIVKQDHLKIKSGIKAAFTKHFPEESIFSIASTINVDKIRPIVSGPINWYKEYLSKKTMGRTKRFDRIKFVEKTINTAIKNLNKKRKEILFPLEPMSYHIISDGDKNMLADSSGQNIIPRWSHVFKSTTTAYSAIDKWDVLSH